ncbi:MAG: oligosaccharide flippase family protein, partial [bacterium]|nr:oligosaccharide flippase family protein [bacterium]
MKFSRQAVVSGLASTSVYLRSIILIPAMARGFSPEDYGIWIQVYGVIELLVVIGSMGLQGSVLRFWHRGKIAGTLARDMSAMLSAVTLVCVALAVGVAAVGDSVASFLWDEPAAGAHLDLLVFLLPLSALSNMMLAVFRADGRVVLHSILLVVESTGFVVVALFLLSNGGGVREVLLALAATRLIVFAAGYATMVRQIGMRMPSAELLRPFLVFSLPLLPIGLFSWISNMSSRYIISHYVGPDAVAEYSIHYSVGSLMGFFFSPVFFVLTPKITQLWEHQDKNAIHEYLLYAQKYPLLVIAPATVILTIHADRVIAMIASEAYTGVPLLIAGAAAAIILLNLSAVAENVIYLALRTKAIPVIYGAVAMANVLMNLLAVPFWGIQGAALVTAATYGLQFAGMYYYARRFLDPFL